MKQPVRSRPRGQSLVEFAIVIPVILLMAIVIFDFGRAIYYSSTIHNAAREGARFGIVNPGADTRIQDKAISYAVGLGLQRGNVAVCWHYNGMIQQAFPPPSVKVTVTYEFRPATPVVAQFLTGGKITLKGEAVMKLESLPTGTLSCQY